MDCLYLSKSIFPTRQVDSGEAEGLCKGDLAPLQFPLLEARVFFLQMLPPSRLRDEIMRIKSQKSCSSKAFLYLDLSFTGKDREQNQPGSDLGFGINWKMSPPGSEIIIRVREDT